MAAGSIAVAVAVLALHGSPPATFQAAAAPVSAVVVGDLPVAALPQGPAVPTDLPSPVDSPAPAPATSEAPAPAATTAAAAPTPASRAGNGRDALAETPQEYARDQLAQRGYAAGQYDCLNELWTRESGWSSAASNPASGAYGIPQSLPGTKMAAEGADWRTNPRTQIRWGLDYIGATYGNPCGADQHSLAHGWY